MNLTTITTETFWMNTPMVVALFFGFAGAVFLAIYILRRIRGEVPTSPKAE